MDQDDPEKRGADLPPAQPGLLLWLNMIAPSRRAKILLGVSALLDVAGVLVVTIAANLVNSHPIPLSLSIIAAALIGLGTFIFSCLVIAELRRQSKRRLPPG